MKNKVLITGCASFIGSYLAELLLEMGFSVYGTIHQDSKNIDHIQDKVTIFRCDILSKEGMQSVLTGVNPDFIFHLAAQSLILPSWQDPEKTFKVNILGTLYLLDVIRNIGLNPIIEVVGSSAEYGGSDVNQAPIKESTELWPSSPYGVSKLTEDMLGYIYWQAYGMKIIRVRPFAIVGPRKVSDACADFARDIAEIEAGKREALSVGNLDVVRDLVDVRDTVKAMWLLAEQGTPGQVYNICSGNGYQMKDILDKLISLSSQHIEIHLDPRRLRPSDRTVVVGDNSRLCHLGWKPIIQINDTLFDILTYWRANV